MCFAKIPEPKKAPPPPDPAKATLDVANQMRMEGRGRSGSDNILARLSDDDVRRSAAKTKLGQ